MVQNLTSGFFFLTNTSLLLAACMINAHSRRSRMHSLEKMFKSVSANDKTAVFTLEKNIFHDPVKFHSTWVWSAELWLDGRLFFFFWWDGFSKWSIDDINDELLRASRYKPRSTGVTESQATAPRWLCDYHLLHFLACPTILRPLRDNPGVVGVSALASRFSRQALPFH